MGRSARVPRGGGGVACKPLFRALGLLGRAFFRTPLYKPKAPPGPLSSIGSRRAGATTSRSAWTSAWCDTSGSSGFSLFFFWVTKNSSRIHLEGCSEGLRVQGLGLPGVGTRGLGMGLPRYFWGSRGLPEPFGGLLVGVYGHLFPR